MMITRTLAIWHFKECGCAPHKNGSNPHHDYQIIFNSINGKITSYPIDKEVSIYTFLYACINLEILPPIDFWDTYDLILYERDKRRPY